MVSHLKQRHGFTEQKVSHVELRLNSHRRPGLTERGLTEGRASQNARSNRKQGLREGRVSQKARLHRSQSVSQKVRPQRSQGLPEGQDLTEGLTERQGFTEDRVSPMKQRQGLTEGRSLVWLQACVSHMTQCRVSHNRQGNRGFRT